MFHRLSKKFFLTLSLRHCRTTFALFCSCGAANYPALASRMLCAALKSINSYAHPMVFLSFSRLNKKQALFLPTHLYRLPPSQQEYSVMTGPSPKDRLRGDVRRISYSSPSSTTAACLPCVWSAWIGHGRHTQR